MKVKVAKRSSKKYVVIVPTHYCNSASNIAKIAEAVKSGRGAAWDIIYEDSFLTVEI